ncbi:hypothetical protein SELMODRAFT_409846 [Selaginella moellendorffii]|uniref:Uncharacterized protein n=1 Tax=Selaginella moellendorffii TaxID=88036 RepID=D8RCM9_SELML|nr:hypothetical protein SELMODRAFT_409846 [Selaginella moellendorffii]
MDSEFRGCILPAVPADQALKNVMHCLQSLDRRTGVIPSIEGPAFSVKITVSKAPIRVGKMACMSRERASCFAAHLQANPDTGWLQAISADKLKCEFGVLDVPRDIGNVTLLVFLQEPKLVSPSNWVLWTEGKGEDGHIHLTCFGLGDNFMFLNREVKQLLQKILVAVPDPLVGADDDELKNLLLNRIEVAECW